MLTNAFCGRRPSNISDATLFLGVMLQIHHIIIPSALQMPCIPYPRWHCLAAYSYTSALLSPHALYPTRASSIIQESMSSHSRISLTLSILSTVLEVFNFFIYFA